MVVVPIDRVRDTDPLVGKTGLAELETTVAVAAELETTVALAAELETTVALAAELETTVAVAAGRLWFAVERDVLKIALAVLDMTLVGNVGLDTVRDEEIGWAVEATALSELPGGITVNTDCCKLKTTKQKMAQGFGRDAMASVITLWLWMGHTTHARYLPKAHGCFVLLVI